MSTFRKDPFSLSRSRVLNTLKTSGVFVLSGLSLAIVAQVQAENEHIEQIIVTAEKTPRPVSELPLTVSQVDQEQLKLIDAVHLNEALARVPGAWISRGNGQEQLTSLRSPVLTGAGSCGEFFIAEDGIASRPSGFCNVNQLFELNTEQAGAIEVIKGPGTVYYGGNALHGVINVLSPEPRQGGEIKLEAGPDDFSRAQLRIGHKSDQHATELRFSGSHDGGYKDDSGYDQQKLALRHDFSGEQWSSKTLFSASNLNQETAGFILGKDSFKNPALKRSNPNPEAYRDASSWRLSSEWRREFGEDASLSITPYARHSEMEFIQHFLPGQALEENEQSSFGLQGKWRQSLSDSLEWTLGAELEVADMELREFQENETDSPSAFLRATIPAGLHYDYQVDSNMLALFSQWRLQLSESTLLDAGLRYERLEYDYDNRTTDGTLKVDGTPCTLFGNVRTCRHARPADREDSFDNVSYQLGLQQNFTEQLSAYVRLANSFRAPQNSELYRLQKGQIQADLDSESLQNLELGLRYFSEQMSVQLAAFAMQKDDFIFRDGDGFYIDEGETKHRGIELDANYALSEQWQLAVAASWAEHLYDNNPDPSLGDIDGNDIDTAPNLQANTRLRWQANEQLLAELEWHYLGDYYLDPQNLHKYSGHSLLNLRLAWQRDSWRLAARMTNLTDRDYAERADFAFGNYRYFVGQGRGLYLSAAYSW
ncbi:TonB-dependent receptor [Pseudoteredinibacter isoporae]|uniref:Outer membrane receptor protein involved in Fe transport n=1 Tax=Pseudoteredinibacter isoporae TaxID=570281 RepID=A0A7X0JV54_9GAMM|nr:TonB-dependent receptor [Pseudoteredinibacter isoporae]MBB6522853.1 outer membrane receptor protein involved in Fe transport [Pseudoteredinibacter isoporae]NHO88379.1 TonB-dependent receptor [Pseudoteredinibacter isoporae]NIB23290.1 TonB-dependent receptor [Pseudoteredinibacter isoporae]